MNRAQRKAYGKKKILLIGLGISLILFVAAIFALDLFKPKTKVKMVANEASSETVIGEDSGSAFLIVEDMSPTELEKELPLTMKETTMQNTIHYMSHQKVRADDKWGAIPLTEQRIDRLLEILEVKDFKYEPLYLSILTRWKNGEFSGAAADHNAIWDLRGGTVGKAYGILSLEEERVYIEENYKLE